MYMRRVVATYVDLGMGVPFLWSHQIYVTYQCLGTLQKQCPFMVTFQGLFEAKYPYKCINTTHATKYSTHAR